MFTMRSAEPEMLASIEKMPMPTPRGPLSEELVAAWTRTGTPFVSPGQLAHARAQARALPPEVSVGDDDLHLALYACYELHYTGVHGVDERWEWEPSLLAFRAVLEEAFESGLRRVVPVTDLRQAGIERSLATIANRPGGAPLAAFVESDATRPQAEEFLMHRSAYNLKEADPHTWVIPRLRGASKAALVEIQSDEYGGGDPAWVHASLFVASLRAMGLDATPGAYVDRLPGTTLATVNLMSLFGLHRRLRGAAMGAFGRVRDDLVRAEPALRRRASPPRGDTRCDRLFRRACRSRRGARGAGGPGRGRQVGAGRAHAGSGCTLRRRGAARA